MRSSHERKRAGARQSASCRYASRKASCVTSSASARLPRTAYATARVTRRWRSTSSANADWSPASVARTASASLMSSVIVGNLRHHPADSQPPRGVTVVTNPPSRRSALESVASNQSCRTVLEEPPMKSYRQIAAVVWSIAIVHHPASVFAQMSESDSTLRRKAQALVNAAIEQGRFSGVALLARNGAPLVAVAGGLADP